MKIDVTKTTVKDGQFGGNVLLADELKPGNKYITGRVNITGVQFIGSIKEAKLMLAKLKNNEIDMVSNFDIHFRYRIGSVIEEPSFGQDGIGCVQGIHFFIDKRTAIKYLKTGFTGIELLTPVITVPDFEDRQDEIKENQIKSRKKKQQVIDMYSEPIRYPLHEPAPFLNCAICNSEIWSRNPVSAECGHLLHIQCVGQDNLKNNKCPLCQKKLF
jgi:hypothetical protein